jgi:hypothetical protein
LRHVVHRLCGGLGVAQDNVGRQLVVRLIGAQLPHKDHPLAVVVPVEGISGDLAGKAGTGRTGTLGCTALELFVQVQVGDMAHQGVISLPGEAFVAVDVVLFYGNIRLGGYIVRDETRLAFGAFFVRSVPSLVIHGIPSIFGNEFGKELYESSVDLRCGLCDVSNHDNIVVFQ